jgi:hypothetical protein
MLDGRGMNEGSHPFGTADVKKSRKTAHDASAACIPQKLSAILVARLERQGVDQAHMAGFFREMQKLLRELPDATLPAVNARLHYLGSRDVTIDYQSMQLTAFCLEDR